MTKVTIESDEHKEACIKNGVKYEPIVVEFEHGGYSWARSMHYIYYKDKVIFKPNGQENCLINLWNGESFYIQDTKETTEDEEYFKAKEAEYYKRVPMDPEQEKELFRKLGIKE